MEPTDINNRKLIIELRIDPIPSLLDSRGNLSDRLTDISELDCKFWKISNDTVEVFNSEKESEITRKVYVSVNRLLFIDDLAKSTINHLELFLKIYDVFCKGLKKPIIRRIGCRIVGSYSPKGEEVIKPVPSFLSLMKEDGLIKDFPVRDANLTITYSSGRYTIGPIRKNDSWVDEHFKHSLKESKSGFAIDTDNFIVQPALDKKGISDNEISTVFETSLQVEETLFKQLSKVYGE